jgi:hypothetical protein
VAFFSELSTLNLIVWHNLDKTFSLLKRCGFADKQAFESVFQTMLESPGQDASGMLPILPGLVAYRMILIFPKHVVSFFSVCATFVTKHVDRLGWHLREVSDGDLSRSPQLFLPTVIHSDFVSTHGLQIQLYESPHFAIEQRDEVALPSEDNSEQSVDKDREILEPGRIKSSRTRSRAIQLAYSLKKILQKWKVLIPLSRSIIGKKDHDIDREEEEKKRKEKKREDNNSAHRAQTGEEGTASECEGRELKKKMNMEIEN